MVGTAQESLSPGYQRNSDCSTAIDEVDDQGHKGENEQDVNPHTQGGEADEANDPEQNKNDSDGPKHK